MHIYEHFHSPFSPRFRFEFGKIFQFSSNLIRAQRSLTHLSGVCERKREGDGTETESGIELGLGLRLGLGLGTPQRVPSFPFCFDYELKYSENSFAPSALSYNKFLVQDKILIFM